MELILTELLKKQISDAQIQGQWDAKSGYESITGGSSKILPLLQILKNEGFDMLLDIVSIDWGIDKNPAERFGLVYLLFHSQKKTRVQVSVTLPESLTIDSVVSVFASANWAEREAWDMMGIVFKGHPNLKRLLTWEAFEGHALRKDYPLDKRQPIPVSEELL